MADAAEIDSAQAETELLQRAQGGDEAAFGTLVRSHYEPVFRRVLAITRHDHDARDVCQEIWLSVWQSLPAFRGDAKFSTWLYAIATRRAIDHLRQRQRWLARFLPFLANDASPSSIAEPASPTPNPRDQLDLAERGARFERAIEALPPKHRAVLALREIEGLSYGEIATTLNCRQGTVMSRLFHARRLLAQKLGDQP